MMKLFICLLSIFILSSLLSFFFIINSKKFKELKLLFKINPVEDSYYFNYYNSLEGEKKSKYFLESLKNSLSNITFCFKSSFDKMKEIIPKIKNLEGDVVEVGVWKGGHAMYVQFLLLNNNINKKLYLYDTYSGFLKNNKNVNIYEKKIQNYNIKPQLQFVKNQFINNNLLRPNIKFIKRIAVTGNKIYLKISLLKC